MALREAVKQFSTKLERIGGVQAYVQRIMTTKDYRAGYFVGQDENGNKFYEDPGYIMARNRYVDYADNANPNPTTITPAWHRWIHYMGDIPPTEKPCPTPEWVAAPKAHPTGTHGDYIPFRTTRPKIEAWDPTK